MEFKSVDFLSSDDESIHISDSQPIANDDGRTQQNILLSVSRADDIHLLTTADYGNSGDKSVEELILSDNASPERLWRKI